MLTGFDLCRAAMNVSDVTGPERTVLLVLAVMANDDAQAWPPISGETGLTTKCVLSERAVQRAVKRLCVLGHLTRKQLRHGVIYTVHPKTAELRPATQSGVSETGDTAAGDVEAARPATQAPKPPVTTIHPKASPSSGAGKRKSSHIRLPEDWKPIRFADETVARDVVDRRGIEWARAALESFRNWAVNADDKPGIGRKLNWQAAWSNWVIEQDRRDGRNGSGNRQHGVQPSGIGRTAEAALDVFGPSGGSAH